MDAQLAKGTEALLERADEITIEFDHVERASGPEQSLGDGPLTRADLDQMLARAGRHRRQDAADGPGIMQKILAEALAGAVFHEDEGRVASG
jgi:hypothetical protein